MGKFGRTLLVFLHGSGGTGPYLQTYLETAPLKAFGYETFWDLLRAEDIDIMTPTAPMRRYSAAGGEKMNVWFDRSPFFFHEGLASQEDVEGIDQAWEILLQKIKEADSKAAYEHIFLGGFSMGGGMIYHAFRTARELLPRVRGVFTMGSFLVEKSAVLDPSIPLPNTIPMLIMHGEDDAMISVEWGKATSISFHLKGCDVQFRTYPKVDHELSPEELEDAWRWMKDILQRVSQSQGKGARQSYLDAKYDEMTEELQHLEGRALEELGDDETDAAHRKPATSEAKASPSQAPQEKTVASSSGTRPGQGAEEKQQVPPHFPYSLEFLDDKPTTIVRVRIHFEVPAEYVPLVTSRPVLACGSTFDILPDPPKGVQTEAVTSDPHKTALEISRRLLIRLESGSSSLNPCTPS